MAITQKIFVLDTSVILYDHNALNNFQEHDVAIPIQVLEELDNMKGGNETRNFEARGFIRLIDELSGKKLINQWVHLNGKTNGRFRVVLPGGQQSVDAVKIFGNDKYDHQIINAALILVDEHPDKKVVLVSKDICLRLKAKSLSLHAEDYETGKIKNVEALYTGKTIRRDVPAALVDALRLKTAAAANGISVDHVGANQFYDFKQRRKTSAAFYHKSSHTFIPVSNTTVCRIKPRNQEQAFALHALLDPSIRLVSIQGNAGTGKTLLALASALEQRKHYRQIYITRPVIPLSNREIGFLPGDAKSKTDPFLAPIWDNIRFIKEQFADDPKMSDKIDELIATEKIAIAPLAFIRGRTL